MYTNIAIVIVNNIKLYDTESMYSSKLTLQEPYRVNHLPTIILKKLFSTKKKSK
jgi:hypothetical protein